MTERCTAYLRYDGDEHSQCRMSAGHDGCHHYVVFTHQDDSRTPKRPVYGGIVLPEQKVYDAAARALRREG